MWSNLKFQVSLCNMTTWKSKTNAYNRTSSTQIFKNPAYVSLSTIPSTAALCWLLNGQDQDKPVNKIFSRILNKSRKNLRKYCNIRMHYLKLTANTNFYKETTTSLSSFKQYNSVSRSMGPQNGCLHIHSDS